MAFRPVYTSQLSDRDIRNIFIQGKYRKKIACSICFRKAIIWITEKKFRCKACWSIGSLTTGTWLEKSKRSLRLWYEIAWCFTLCLSARKAGRLLNVTGRDCWQMYQTIRYALVEKSKKQRRKITGTVELDESFYGGTFKNLRKKVRMELRRLGLNKRGGGAKYRKQPVFGIFKRNGKVYLEPIPETKVKILYPIIKKKVKIGADVFLIQEHGTMDW